MAPERPILGTALVNPDTPDLEPVGVAIHLLFAVLTHGLNIVLISSCWPDRNSTFNVSPRAAVSKKSEITSQGSGYKAPRQA